MRLDAALEFAEKVEGRVRRANDWAGNQHEAKGNQRAAKDDQREGKGGVELGIKESSRIKGLRAQRLGVRWLDAALEFRKKDEGRREGQVIKWARVPEVE